MPRRAHVVRRTIAPDAKYGSRLIGVFINKLMKRGKKSVAERIMYQALDDIEQQRQRNPVEVFEEAVRNTTPVVEVKPRRVGGATYQVPVDIRAERRQALAVRWLLHSARSRRGRTMSDRLAAELIEAANNQGAAVKQKADTHRMAEANRAFAHYRW
ncbi:MAG: 30S ribosomal protein S7 [Dehalococcoidia bacterium]|nr:30S ribosomal protein S7 [Candidatus Omnitrophota bacterium]MDZ4278716.1 30S ribosomal protein S7 [Dehalococcoidia bacterium]